MQKINKPAKNAGKNGNHTKPRRGIGAPRDMKTADRLHKPYGKIKVNQKEPKPRKEQCDTAKERARHIAQYDLVFCGKRKSTQNKRENGGDKRIFRFNAAFRIVVV